MSRTDDRRQTTERLDIAIDRAVRDMLDVEPPAGLRGRVLDRIEQPRRTFGWTWVLVPLAAAAVIILAVLTPWRHAEQPVSSAPIIAKAQPTVVVPNAEAPKPAHSLTVSIPLPHATPSGRRPSPRGVEEPIVVAADAPADQASAIDPLAPIAPIAVAAVRPPAIPQKEIAISPLAAIAELQIAPLSPPERRN